MIDTRTTEALGLLKEAAMYAVTYGRGKWTEDEVGTLLDTLTARLTAYEAEGTPELFALLRAEHGAGRCSFETYTHAHIAVEKYLDHTERVTRDE